MSKEEVIAALTESVLIGRGYEVDDRELDIEWDGDNPDSQYSLVREDVVIAVEALEELGLLSF
jgi:hypothetical protein